MLPLPIPLLSVIDSSEMVMATTIYSCGPAALATVLRNLGIYVTEAEIATLAGTDETGTSLYGLKVAAQSKGATAIGARLTTDQLKANYIVVLNIEGTNHFEVIKNITSTTVTLIDPNLGTIEMSLEKFNELYTGVALIINGSAPAGAILLTDDDMKNIKANGYWTSVYLFSYPVVHYDVWYEWWDFGDITVWYPYWDWNTWSWQWASYTQDLGGMWVPHIDYWIEWVPVYQDIYIPDMSDFFPYTYSYAADNNSTQEKEFNWDRVVAIGVIAGGCFLVGASVIGDISSLGTLTLPAAYTAYSGITFITIGTTYLMMTWKESWWK